MIETVVVRPVTETVVVRPVTETVVVRPVTETVVVRPVTETVVFQPLPVHSLGIPPATFPFSWYSSRYLSVLLVFQ